MVRAGIAAILDKFQIFTVADRARGQLEGVQINLVARAFAVKGKAIAQVADLNQPLREPPPGKFFSFLRFVWRGLRIGGLKRVLKQHVLDVGQ